MITGAYSHSKPDLCGEPGSMRSIMLNVMNLQRRSVGTFLIVTIYKLLSNKIHLEPVIHIESKDRKYKYLFEILSFKINQVYQSLTNFKSH